MKALLLGISLLGIIGVSDAQDAADKKVQAGLVVGYGMNFQKMGTKFLESDGVGSDLTIGANVNIGINETFAFCTGIEFDFESLKYKVPSGSNIRYVYNTSDNGLVRLDANTDPDVNGYAFDPDYISDRNLYQLESRKQSPLYLTIPTMMMFRTNYIGYFRYFGKFGLRTSVLLANKFTDQGANIDATGTVINTEENKDMRASGEMFPVKSAVGLAGGAEWNFIGSTVLVGEIGYYYGFTPLYNNRTFLADTGGDNNGIGNDTYFANKATQMQLMFKLSILF